MPDTSKQASPRAVLLRTRRFDRSLRTLTDAEYERVINALEVLTTAFGDVHSHAGLGIRKLRRRLFECRAGLDLRILFKLEGGTRELILAGSHDHIRRYLKEGH